MGYSTKSDSETLPLACQQMRQVDWQPGSKRPTKLGRRSLLLIGGLFFSFIITLFLSAPINGAPVLPYPVETRDEQRRSAQDSNARRVQRIESLVNQSARDLYFGAPGTPDNNAAPAMRAPKTLFDLITDFLSHLVGEVLRIIVDWLAPFVISLIHNPNVASPYSDEYVTNFANVPYDLVGPLVKDGIRQSFALMRALAVNLLLLLFILSIWKYWTEAGARQGQHAQHLVAAVGRLIATAGLILFWPVISYHVVQISNEMIDYVYRSINPIDLELALQKVSNLAARGGTVVLLGESFRVLGGPGAAVSGALTGVVGPYLLFLFFGIAVYELVYLVVLKAVQTALMLAQFSFAPMFLVFFATPSTEYIATGFIKSCVEVSLWTFVWAGLVRVLVVILAYGDNVWGDFIMLLGILQIMLQVPAFMAKAQISPVSDFISPGGAIKGLATLGKTVGSGWKSWWDHRKDDETSHDLAGKGGKGSSPGQGGSSGSPNFQGGGVGPAGGASPPKKGKNHYGNPAAGGQPAYASLQEALADLVDQLDTKKRIGQLKGQHGSIQEDGEKDITSITHGLNDTPEEKALTEAQAALARRLMGNNGARKAIGDWLGKKVNPLSSTPIPQQQHMIDKAINEAAIEGTKAFFRGERGNIATDLLRQQYGDMTPEALEDMQESLMYPELPHSVRNPNYARNKKTVESANLPVNAATMAAAEQPAMSKLNGREFGAAYRALAANARADSANNGLAGLTNGTRAHTNALGHAISGMSPDRAKLAAAVGLGLMGDPTAETYSDEEMDAWTDAAEELVKKGGARDGRAAVEALKGMAAACPAKFAKGDPPSAARTAAVKAALGHAVSGAMAMNEARIPADALSNANLARQVHDLAAGGKLTPQKMQALRAAAEAKGLDTFTPADVEDVETMVETLGYSLSEARNSLAYAQSIRETMHPGSTNPSQLPTSAVAQRMSANGFGVNLPAIALAMRPEFNGMKPAQAAVASRQLMAATMEQRGLSGTPNSLGPVMQVVLADTIDHMDTELVDGFIQIARSDAGARYNIPMVQAAVDVTRGGNFGGRVDRAVVALEAVMDTSGSASGAVPLNPAEAGRVVMKMDTAQIPGRGYRIGEVVQAFTQVDDAELADPVLRESLAQMSGFHQPGRYVEQAYQMADFARVAGTAPSKIGPAQMQILEEYVASGQEAGGDVVRAIVRMQPVAGGGAINVQEINVRVHPDLDALPANQFGGVFAMAENMARHEANTANVAAAEVENYVGSKLLSMSRERRAMLVAIESAGDATLRDQALAQYVARIETISEATGIRDAVKTLQFVSKVMNNAPADAGSVETVANALEFMGRQNVSHAAMGDPEKVAAVGNLSSAYKGPSSAPYTARAIEIYPASNINDGNIDRLKEMSGSYGYILKSIDSTDAERFETMRTAAPGCHPTRQFIGNLVQAGIPITAANAERLQIASLEPIMSLRADAIGPACDAVQGYLHASGTKRFNSVADLKSQDLFVNTLIGVEKVHDAAQCANVAYVEKTYDHNIKPPAGHTDFGVNVNGMGLRILPK